MGKTQTDISSSQLLRFLESLESSEGKNNSNSVVVLEKSNVKTGMKRKAESISVSPLRKHHFRCLSDICRRLRYARECVSKYMCTYIKVKNVKNKVTQKMLKKIQKCKFVCMHYLWNYKNHSLYMMVYNLFFLTYCKNLSISEEGNAHHPFMTV